PGPARGARRRHDRLHRDRPRPAPPRREGRRVRAGGERRRRPRDAVAAHAPAGRRARPRPPDRDRQDHERAGRDPRPSRRNAGRRARGGPDGHRPDARMDGRGAGAPHDGRRPRRPRPPRRGRGAAAGPGRGAGVSALDRSNGDPAPALLALADGTVFRGAAFGASGEVSGEVVFNTALSGYQEILTDPSYEGQLVAMTYPEIGNVGVNAADVESVKPWVRGFIVREYWPEPSSLRAEETLAAYMERHGIVGIQCIDTRALVRHLRTAGSQQAILTTTDLDESSAVARARALPSLEGQDLASAVPCREPYDWDEGRWQLGKGYLRPASFKHFVVAYDYGLKRNILRNLVDAGCRVRVVPAQTPASEVLAMKPDGVF